jgi:hypothetical protein
VIAGPVGVDPEKTALAEGAIRPRRLTVRSPRSRPLPKSGGVVMNHTLGGLAALPVLFFFTTIAQAGVVIVRTGNNLEPPAPCAGIAATDADGNIWSAGDCDNDGDGLIIFHVPQAVQNSADGCTVVKRVENYLRCGQCLQMTLESEGPYTDRHKFNAADGFTLAMAEPFQTDTFLPVDPTAQVVASINVQPYLAAGNPFASCGTFAVSNGTTPLSPNVLFKDGSSLSSNLETRAIQLLDPAVFNALPNLTGTLRACDETQFQQNGVHVPALGDVGLAILVVSMAALGGWILLRAKA